MFKIKIMISIPRTPISTRKTFPKVKQQFDSAMRDLGLGFGIPTIENLSEDTYSKVFNCRNVDYTTIRDLVRTEFNGSVNIISGTPNAYENL